ncbi:MAG: hypothetical protein CM1200mP41_13820 [Gammaproteobacteria bacterium]|nr:MAG: hypothetical protein CM1200mP41_13820 [Gammaproteobacteria bacterium]
MLIILPFWTPFSAANLCLDGLLADQGHQQILIYFGLINRPIRLMYSEFAVISDCLFLSAVHDSAALRQHGKVGSHNSRGRGPTLVLDLLRHFSPSPYP